MAAMKTLRQAALIIALMGTSVAPAAALAPLPFTEDFATNASGWLSFSNTAPNWFTNGGVGDSGYISYSLTFTSPVSGPFGGPPQQIMFRGNAGNDASGDAFVGNWLSGGVTFLSLAVRHNYTETLYFYARLDAGSGRAASSAFDVSFAIPATNTWTAVTIPIVDSNPPFVSYGAGTFTSVFTNIQNLQFGVYVPTNTIFTDFRMDIDGVSAVPEPSTWALLACAATALASWRLRRRC
jgi:hypothetical protein